MAVSNLPIYPQTVQTWTKQIVNASGTGTLSLATAGANGSVVESLTVSNTDSGVAYTLQLWVNDGTADELLASINIPINAGNVAGTAAVDILRSGMIPGLPIDTNGNPVIMLKATYILKVSVTVAVTAAKTVYCVAQGMDY